MRPSTLIAAAALLSSCATATPPADTPDTPAPVAPPANPPPSPSPSPSPAPSVAPASHSAAPSPSPARAASPSPEETTFETSGPLTATEEQVLKIVVVCVRSTADKGEPSSKPLDVELAVEASGRVSDVRLAAGYARGAAACVKRELGKLTYPARPAGGIEFVRYPIAEIEEEPASD